MKIIIRESQYNLILNEDKGRIEFPGIEFFNGDWNIVAKHLNKFTFNGKIYNNLIDIKEYIIDLIKKKVAASDGWIDMIDFNLLIASDYYNSYLSSLSKNFVTVVLYPDDWDEDEVYSEIPYNDLRFDDIKDILYALI